jgi:hypothetical protein
VSKAVAMKIKTFYLQINCISFSLCLTLSQIRLQASSLGERRGGNLYVFEFGMQLVRLLIILFFYSLGELIKLAFTTVNSHFFEKRNQNVCKVRRWEWLTPTFPCYVHRPIARFVLVFQPMSSRRPISTNQNSKVSWQS